MRQAFCFYEMSWRQLECVFGYTVTCGGQLMDKSVFDNHFPDKPGTNSPTQDGWNARAENPNWQPEIGAHDSPLLLAHVHNPHYPLSAHVVFRNKKKNQPVRRGAIWYRHWQCFSRCLRLWHTCCCFSCRGISWPGKSSYLNNSQFKKSRQMKVALEQMPTWSSHSSHWQTAAVQDLTTSHRCYLLMTGTHAVDDVSNLRSAEELKPGNALGFDLYEGLFSSSEPNR